ncbi:MAG: hypothetical protein V1780_02040, partial [Chloroflexota bacterium]
MAWGKLKPRKRGFPWLWVIVALFTAALFAPVFWHVFVLNTPLNLPNLKAAIIDQLYTEYPNENFTTEVKGALEAYGFQVDVYQGSEVTVNLYRNLPSYDYKLIIIRSHSGIERRMDLIERYVTEYIVLFTNEPYTTGKYPFNQLDDSLVEAAVTEDSPRFFGITPKFISNSMQGNLRNTVVIVAGCALLHDNIMASAFTQKGASAFLAWNG